LFTLLALICLAVPAAAQDCTIAAYLDPEGTVSWGFPDLWSDPIEYSVYVVLFTEDTVAAAAYQMTVSGSGSAGPYEMWRSSGPSGNGLSIDEPTGTNVALAECVIGFGSRPVVIDEYRYVAFPSFYQAIYTIGPNASQDPVDPMYVDCNDALKSCSAGSPLWVIMEFDTEATSFGAIKSLYHKD
jgi:hypothetical protein